MRSIVLISKQLLSIVFNAVLYTAQTNADNNSAFIRFLWQRKRNNPMEEAEYFVNHNIDRDGLVKAHIDNTIGK